MHIAEDVDAWALGGAESEPALGVHAARSGRRQLEDVCDRARSSLLGEPQQVDEDLARRPGVRQRPVAGLRRGAEEVRQRRKAHARGAAGEKPPRQPDRVQDGQAEPPSMQPLDLMVQKADVEPRIVGHEHAVAGEIEEAGDSDPG